MTPTPPTLLVLAFGAGLTAGLARFPAWPLVLGWLALAWMLGRGDRLVLPLALALGAMNGTLARRLADAECAAGLAGGAVRASVRLLGPGRPGRVAARPADRTCRGELQLRWPERPAVAAGTVAEVEGRWIPRAGRLDRPGGVLVVTRVRPTGRSPALRGTLADRLGARAAALYGARAPLVEALVLGRRDGLDPDLRDAFARAGVVHLLAISGFHVGLLAGWVLLLVRAAGAPRARAMVVAALAAQAYVWFLGWPPPATRAAWLAALATWCRLRQRRPRPGPVIAVTCLAVVLIDPWAVAEPGAWLSAAAIWGVTVFTRWSDRAVGTGWAVRMLFASLGATLATAPITALAFGTVAPAGVVLNFAAIPLASLAVPGVFASLALAPFWHAGAAALAGGAGLALAGLEAVARVGGAAPGASLVFEPTAAAALPWVAALGVARWSLARFGRWPEALRRAAWGLTALLWVGQGSAWLAALGPAESGLTLHLLQVGQGDAAALRTPHGAWVVIDAGPATREADAGRRVVVPFLRRHGTRRVATLVVSHAHLDHLGGASAVLERFRVDHVVEPAVPVAEPAYLGLLDAVLDEGAAYHPGRAGDAWEVDGVRFQVLHPDTTWAGWHEDLNEDSIVLLVTYGGFRAVFAGDAGLPVEARLAGRVGAVALLKVGHHGSRGASGAAWLAELQPRLAVISVGPNRYGHPNAEALRRLEVAGASVWRTDRDGTVTVWTDGRRVEARGRGRREQWVIANRQGGRRARHRRQDHRSVHPRAGTQTPRGDRRAHPTLV